MKLFRLKPPQFLVVGFAVIILIGAVLLSLPAASADGKSLPFINALFTATSATCVTGLVVVDTGTHFTLFGQWVILALIQVGGLGFMSMATLIWMMLGKKISLRERLILQESLNQSSMEGVVRLIRKVLLYSILIELGGALLLSVRFMFDMSPLKAIYFGVFHAISFFNNAGFDIMGDFRSMTPYERDPIVNLTSMALIVLGGLGFIVLSELFNYKKPLFRFSLHTKLVLTTTAFLIVSGAIVIFVFEYTNRMTLGPLSFDGKLWGALFQSVTPRTAGVNTIDIGSMRQATQFFMIILMFIGASPGSTGGGIKTTTFITLIGAMTAMIRGKEDIVYFRCRLAQEQVYKAITLTLLSLFWVIFASMVMSTTEPHHFLMILFEVTSAFGTVGLSMGLTPMLTIFGKIMIILTMFIGRLGPITLAYALWNRGEKELYRHPEGKIMIG
ncbi:MAG: Trk family potassium uptake protein [Paenibacillus sp. RIFOXYA1_FULL_44_5]|nr:MAG: Trk family potassium uptake protein [Paenibacillus sp. RIFOXYA1_FULL_44_5]